MNGELLSCTLFQNVRDVQGKEFALSWDRLRQYLGEERLWAEKNADYTQLIGPVFNGTKSKSAFARMHVAIVDIDGPTHTGESIEKVKRFLAQLDAANIAYVAASSYSHGFLPPGLCKLHVFIPLARPIMYGPEWHHTFDWLQQFSGGLLDPKLRDEHMAVFLPCLAQGADPERRIFWSRDGNGLNVDWIGTQQVATPTNGASVLQPLQFTTADVVTEKDLKDFAKKLKRSRTPEDQAHGRLLLRALEGQKIAEPGNRHDTLVALGWRLGKEYPYGNSIEMANCIRVSLAQMAADGDQNGKLNPEGFAEKIQTAQRKHLADRADWKTTWQEKEASADKARAERIRDCFRRVGVDRSKPYGSDELAQMAKDRGLSIEAAKRRWIVHYGGSYYFYVAGQYTSPMPKDAAEIAARIHLEPTGLSLETTTPTGTPKAMSLKELTDVYGVVANGVEADLQISKSYFDEKTQIIHEAICPRVEHSPIFHPQVATWLQLFAGLHYEKLQDWLATFPNLEKPTSALFMYGPKRVGKTLLANGVAALWNNPITELESVMGNFNDKLAQNPVVFGDEVIPQDRQGDPDTAFLRKFVQERTRSYKRKFLPTSNLVGCARLLIAANSPDILVGRKRLRNNDIEAINERIFCLEVQKEAAEYLARPDVNLTLKDIAEHVTALWMYRHVKEGPRFWVEGESGSELEELLRTSSGLRSEICRFVCSYLTDPQKSENRPKHQQPQVRTIRGELSLVVTASVLHGLWEIYCSGDGRPRIGSISDALGHLSTRTTLMVDGVRKNMRIINLDMVAKWGERTGEMSADEIVTQMVNIYHYTTSLTH